jgi:hypothetical protein
VNLHTVIRGLVQGFQNTEANKRQMLLAIEADEKGYPDLETYEAELAAQAEVLAAGNRAAMEVEQSAAPDPRDAEIASLQARLAAPDARAAVPVPAGEVATAPAEDSAPA